MVERKKKLFGRRQKKGGSTKGFIIYGRVLEKESGKGIANLKVEALDKDLIFDDRLGTVTTDKKGNFKIQYTADDFQELFFDKKPDIYLNIKDQKGRILHTTKDKVRYHAGKTEKYIMKLPRKLFDKKKKVKPQKRPKIMTAVFDHNNKVLPNAKVTLTLLGEKKDKTTELKFDKQWQNYVIADIKPGQYLLRVEAKGLETDEREVRVDIGGLKEIMIIGKKGMPHYYRGKVKVPFEPPSDLLGVSIKPELPEKEEKQLIEFVQNFKLKLEEVGQPILEDNVRVFRFPKQTSKADRLKIQRSLEGHTYVRLVGPVIHIDKETVSFLTKQLIVKFKVDKTEEEVNRFAKELSLMIIRKIPYAPNTFLLQTEIDPSYEILDICNKIVASKMVEYAQPNLVITAVDLQVNPTDFLYPEQWHLPLINIPAAWQILQNANPPGIVPGGPGDLTYGSEDIIIAIMDRGIPSQTLGGVTTAIHPDFDGTVTSGDDKVYQFFNFATMASNNDAPPNNHGIGCAGVATALVNNPSVIAGVNEGVVGAAPNCRVMGLIRPAGLTELRYADAFIWTGGLDPGWVIDGINYFVGEVLPPVLARGADIINNSFRMFDVVQPLVEEAFDYLTTYGRGGKGIPIFFASGNADTDASIHSPTTCYEKVITVGASSIADDGITEIRATYSNFGNEIDVCAPSHDEYFSILSPRLKLHNPPANYAIFSCDLLGDGNLTGHPAVQTNLTAVAPPAPFTSLTGHIFNGDTTLNVVNNAGFAVNQWILVGSHPVTEFVRITGIPGGGTQLTVTAIGRTFRAGTTVLGATTLTVNNTDGFVVNQWLFLDQPGIAGAEAALIRALPGGNTIEIAGPLNNHANNTPVIFGPQNYKNSFGGTSSAAPLTAGVAALLLSANPDLTWVQVRQILIDTSIQIDLGNADPVGQWIDTDGDGNVDFSQWYGYGRINAQNAVQEALNLVGVNPVNHIDTWIKENSTDIGDVPETTPYWSPDVWVRNLDPGVDNQAQIDQHQSPIRGQSNWIYANIRNRGANDSHDVYARIYITRWAGTQYIYPDDFIPTVPPSDNPTTPLAPGTYLIGEVHIDTIPANGFVTINLEWLAHLIPAATVVVDGTQYSWADSCILVDVSPHDGPTPTGNHTWDNNNLCQKNITIVDPRCATVY
jgi:hypothetical protein